MYTEVFFSGFYARTRSNISARVQLRSAMRFMWPHLEQTMQMQQFVKNYKLRMMPKMSSVSRNRRYDKKLGNAVILSNYVLWKCSEVLKCQMRDGSLARGFCLQLMHNLHAFLFSNKIFLSTADCRKSSLLYTLAAAAFAQLNIGLYIGDEGKCRFLLYFPPSPPPPPRGHKKLQLAHKNLKKRWWLEIFCHHKHSQRGLYVWNYKKHAAWMANANWNFEYMSKLDSPHVGSSYWWYFDKKICLKYTRRTLL